MPGSTLSYSSSSVFGSHSGMSRAGIESSLIVNKVQSGLDAATATGTADKMNVDSALLQLELKRHERKRHLLRYGDFDFNNEEKLRQQKKEKEEEAARIKAAAAEAAAVAEVTISPEERVAKHAKDLEQWVKKMRCSGPTGVKIDNFRDIKVGVLSDEVRHKAPSLEPYPKMDALEHKFKGGKDKNGLYMGKGEVEFENGDTITGFFKVGTEKG